MSNEDFGRQYAETLELLNGIGDQAAEHVREVPDCPGLPLCIGADNLVGLYVATAFDPTIAYKLIMVSVHELRKARERVRQLEAGLADLSLTDEAIEKILRPNGG